EELRVADEDRLLDDVEARLEADLSAELRLHVVDRHVDRVLAAVVIFGVHAGAAFAVLAPAGQRRPEDAAVGVDDRLLRAEAGDHGQRGVVVDHAARRRVDQRAGGTRGGARREHPVVAVARRSLDLDLDAELEIHLAGDDVIEWIGGALASLVPADEACVHRPSVRVVAAGVAALGGGDHLVHRDLAPRFVDVRDAGDDARLVAQHARVVEQLDAVAVFETEHGVASDALDLDDGLARARFDLLDLRLHRIARVLELARHAVAVDLDAVVAVLDVAESARR